MFVVAAVPGFVLAAIVLFMLREPARGAFEIAQPAGVQERAPLPQTITAIFASRPLLWVTAAGVLVIMALATLLAAPFGVVAYTTSVTAIAIPLLFVFQVLGMCFYGATLAAIIQLAPVRVRGSVITYLMLVLNLGGYGFGPQVVGGISDYLRWLGVKSSLGWGLAVSTVLMLVSALCYFIAFRHVDGQSSQPVNVTPE